MNAIILLAILGVITMVSDILGFKKAIWYIIIPGLLGTIYLNFQSWNSPELFYEMIYIDKFSVSYSILILSLIMVWFFISKEQYDSSEFNSSDNYALILFASVGALLLTSYIDLTLLFLGIEILSIPLFILAGSRKKDLASNEASLKYFIMGAFATGILLFGITFIYGATGSFKLEKIAAYAALNSGDISGLFYIGVLLVMIGLGFKVAAVPFHFWTPDVYHGSPTFVTAFMATVVKTAAFAGFLRLFSTCFTNVDGGWNMTLSVLIGLTILVGNILAVYQESPKRMLAYSGIAQAGYMLLSILVLTQETKTALLLYLASYSLASLAAFTVLFNVSKTNNEDSFEAFNGLGKSNPFLAFIMTVAMLSLAGIPPAVGFFAKFNLFAAVLRADFSTIYLVGIAVFGSLVSVYYYFKVIINMYAKEKSSIQTEPVSISYKAILLFLASIIVLLGVAPNIILNLTNL